MGFKDPKKGDQMAEKTLHFKREQKVCGKWYKGSLSESMSRDEEGLAANWIILSRLQGKKLPFTVEIHGMAGRLR